MAGVPSPTDSPTMSPWWWFVAWFLVGCLYSLAVLGALTIGVFVLPFAIAATLLLLRGRQAVDGLPGLLSGLSGPVFYVASLNRDGPGMICTKLQGGEQCTEEWSPWPWVAVGTALFLAGIAVFMLLRRSRERRRASSAPTTRDV